MALARPPETTRYTKALEAVTRKSQRWQYLFLGFTAVWLLAVFGLGKFSQSAFTSFSTAESSFQLLNGNATTLNRGLEESQQAAIKLENHLRQQTAQTTKELEAARADIRSLKNDVAKTDYPKRVAELEKSLQALRKEVAELRAGRQAGQPPYHEVFAEPTRPTQPVEWQAVPGLRLRFASSGRPLLVFSHLAQVRAIQQPAGVSFRLIVDRAVWDARIQTLAPDRPAAVTLSSLLRLGAGEHEVLVEWRSDRGAPVLIEAIQDGPPARLCAVELP